MTAYPIVATNGTLNATNYTFSFVNGTLTVTPAPTPVILSIGLTNQVVTVTWSSVSNETYELQATTNLNGTNWNPVLPAVTATGPTIAETNASSGVLQQFYRVTLLPP